MNMKYAKRKFTHQGEPKLADARLAVCDPSHKREPARSCLRKLRELATMLVAARDNTLNLSTRKHRHQRKYQPQQKKIPTKILLLHSLGTLWLEKLQPGFAKNR